jgi:hypothetical protein
VASELVWTQRLEEKSLEQTVRMLKGTTGAPPRLNVISVVVEWLTLLHRARQVPCSNLGSKSGYVRFIVVAVSSQANSSTVPEIRPRVLPSKSFPIHPSQASFYSTPYSLSYRESVVK